MTHTAHFPAPGPATRVVQVANFYSSRSGGLRTALEQIGRGYVDRGIQRILVVPGAADTDSRTPAGRRITLRGAQVPGNSGYRVLTRPRALRETVARLRPHRIEVSDKLLLGWLAPWARANGVALLLLSHERLDAIAACRLPGWFPLVAAADRLNRRLSAAADTVVATSRFSLAEWRRAGVDNVRLVPFGVDLDVFRPVSVRPVHRDPLLVSVGRLSREKEPALAIDALRRLRADGVRATLIVVGDGPLRNDLVAAAGDLPVRFVGHLADPRAVAHVVGHADVVLEPSSVESFGLATLEALACGTPVVTPSLGAAAELVPDGGGTVVTGSAAGVRGEDLAAGVERVLDLPVDSRRAAARAAAERYPWSTTVSGLLDAHGLPEYAEVSGRVPA